VNSGLTFPMARAEISCGGPVKKKKWDGRFGEKTGTKRKLLYVRNLKQE
jgi:hypothetical protein